MILRAIHVEHWRCIAGLHLDRLSGGIAVLYGPNQTGKSSLVKAVRGCLFDFDHDSSKAELKSCFPQNGAGPPRVAIEFERSNRLYRITKVFARREGFARLEEKSGECWREIAESSKEATRKTRELLGIDQSDQGLNQLLWLDQGTITLPKAKDLDRSLERHLIAVLGIMVTSRDLAFKQRLEDRMSVWYGARGDHKPTSQVRVYERRLEECRKRLAEEQAKAREVEQAIEGLTECQQQLPICEEQLRQARGELQDVIDERRHAEQRRLQHREAQRDHQIAAERVSGIEQKVHSYRESKNRWQEFEQQSAQAKATLDVKQREQDRLKASLGEIQQQLEAARSTEDSHLTTREDIEQRTRLVGLKEQCRQLEARLKRADELRAVVRQLQRQIQEHAGPDKNTVEALRDNRQRAGKLRAHIQAQAITVHITAKRPLSAQVKRDGDPAQAHELQPDKCTTWTIQDRAAIELGELASFEIVRGKKNGEGESAAQTLAKLDREFQDVLVSAGERPDDEDALNRLGERRVARELAGGKLESVKNELRQIMPEFAQAELSQLESQRKIILERRPDLAGWRAGEEDLAGHTKQFRLRAEVLQKARKELEQTVERHARQLQAVSECLWTCNEQALVAQTSARNSLEDLNRLGDELTLAAQLKEARAALAEAERHVAEMALSEAEKSIDERVQVAEAALKSREHRLAQVREDLAVLRGRLEGSEGLHPRLAEAEAAIVDAETNLVRESTEAAAHKRLHELFEECRDNQVQTVMGPIADRVLSWAHTIGLGDYREVRFGDRFLPEGIVSHGGDPQRARTLADESYGTTEQLSLLIRLALGGILAKDEQQVAILDDPLAHADASKHRRILDIIRLAAQGNSAWKPPAGKLQILILTCHPDRFDYLTGVEQIDLAKRIVREAPNA
jgi:DNA repair exonuclease SbcCD ATPase subunit